MGTSFPKSYSHTVALSYVHIYIYFFFFPLFDVEFPITSGLILPTFQRISQLDAKCRNQSPRHLQREGVSKPGRLRKAQGIGTWSMFGGGQVTKVCYLRGSSWLRIYEPFTEVFFRCRTKTIKSWTWKNYNSSPTFSLKERWTLELEGINYTIATPTTRPRTLAASLAHLLWGPQNMWGDDGRCGCVSEIWSRSEVIRHMYYCRLKLCIWSLGMVNANWSEFKNVACLERRIITLDWKSVLHTWCHAINCSIQDV